MLVVICSWCLCASVVTRL